ncbi:hypothetical protein BC936DRAFT_145816 [Jimgerdemannia flammicorona]|uniref:Uncharacterized protein n=1 Tax=Jimgerdemannia flammicorona TaxID=994334 RepID=A0A433D919_9FUNG|nr:hypothetical protein BC936DRAFT_145816 [Jimgerdemannia flammicorona]
MVSLNSGGTYGEKETIRFSLVADKHHILLRFESEAYIPKCLCEVIDGGGEKVVEFGDSGGEKAVELGDGGGEKAVELGDGDGKKAVELSDGGCEKAVELGNDGGEKAVELGDGDGEKAVELGDGGGEEAAELGDGGGEKAVELGDGGGEKAVELDGGGGEGGGGPFLALWFEICDLDVGRLAYRIVIGNPAVVRRRQVGSLGVVGRLMAGGKLHAFGWGFGDGFVGKLLRVDEFGQLLGHFWSKISAASVPLALAAATVPLALAAATVPLALAAATVPLAAGCDPIPRLIG